MNLRTIDELDELAAKAREQAQAVDAYALDSEFWEGVEAALIWAQRKGTHGRIAAQALTGNSRRASA